MFKEESSMAAISIGLKYRPAKDDLLLVWRATRHSLKYWRNFAEKLQQPKTRSVFRRLRVLMTLQQVSRKLHQKDCSFWGKSSGRYVSRTAGPVIFLANCGVVKKLSKKKKKS